LVHKAVTRNVVRRSPGSAQSLTRKALTMQRSHCARATLVRRSVLGRSLHRFSFESLEERTVLCAASAPLEDGLASAKSHHAEVAADVGGAQEEQAPPVPAAAALDGTARASAVGGFRLNGLRLVLAQSTLRPRHRVAVESTGGETLNAISLATATDESRFEDLSPTSKYCRIYSLTLCKVPLDEGVDPIYKCQGVGDEYCLPERPLQSPESDSLSGSRSQLQLTSPLSAQRVLR
jgi:hypothetical protein